MLGWEQDAGWAPRTLGKETFWVLWALSLPPPSPSAFPLLGLCGILEATGRTVPKGSSFLKGSQWPSAALGDGGVGSVWLFSP